MKGTKKMLEIVDIQPDDDKVWRISHSTGEAFQACEKKYELAHVENIAPKNMPHQLALGIYGHGVFQKFFEVIKDTNDAQLAQVTALRHAYQDIFHFDKIGNELIYWFDNIWPTLGWKIIEVEKTFYLKLNETTEFPFTVDLIIELNGQLFIVDHKFTADAYDEPLLLVYPQLPKYMGALRAKGYAIKGALYNIIRTRSMKDMEKKMVIQKVPINNERIKNSFKIHLNTIDKIKNHTGEYVRNVGYGCKFCSFVDLCGLEMNGQDSTALKANDFTENTYGYAGEEL
jgi:hypothetical protein